MKARRNPLPRPTVRPSVERLEDRTVMDAAMLDSSLGVRVVTEGLITPTGMAFIDSNEFLVLEKNTGKVQYVVDGEVQSTALDLAVNFASERGLLSIALDPDFETNHFVYLYWTQPAAAPANPFVPSVVEGPDVPVLGSGDTNNVLAVPLLGNRVDRFIWTSGDAPTLTFDQNLIKLRAFQNDAAPTPTGQGDGTQPALGNHDGGIIRFGPDGMLYVIIGDVGRRGQLQNLEDGPTPPTDDDQFGGPEPDDAHLTGVILRLNPEDGSAPEDNPFFDVGADIGGEVGANLQKVFAYGIRNSFGLAFDPISGALWQTENGDDSFDELNLVEAGMNGGWVQIMGPAERAAEFKAIETSDEFFGLQQLRWSPENIADTTAEALSRLFMLPGAHYSDPEFSWKFAVPPTALTFTSTSALGSQFFGDLFVGNGAGQIMHFNLTGNRTKLAFDDHALADLVDDNFEKFVPFESQSLVIGTGFGIITDIVEGPNGNLYVVSINGTVYEIFRDSPGRGRGRPSRNDGLTDQALHPQIFITHATGDQEVPPNDSRAQSHLILRLSPDGTELTYRLIVANIQNVVGAHLHLGEAGTNGPIVVSLFGPAAPGGGRTSGVLAEGTITSDDLEGPLAGTTLADLVDAIEDGDIYMNVHTNDGVPPTNTGPGDIPGGEVRGQVRAAGKKR
jgi:glucose/arabinose dehydrogenase